MNKTTSPHLLLSIVSLASGTPPVHAVAADDPRAVVRSLFFCPIHHVDRIRVLIGCSRRGHWSLAGSVCRVPSFFCSAVISAFVACIYPPYLSWPQPAPFLPTAPRLLGIRIKSALIVRDGPSRRVQRAGATDVTYLHRKCGGRAVLKHLETFNIPLNIATV